MYFPGVAGRMSFPGMAANFRAQPMVSWDSHQIVGVELLYRHRINFSDTFRMLEVDIEAIKAAKTLRDFYGGRYRIHCNVELSSILNIDWVVAMAAHICPGIVIEIVERNDVLKHPLNFHQISNTCAGIRALGGAVAMDDVEGTDLEANLINALRPEVLKANNLEGLEFIRSVSSHQPIVVAEHIESPDIAAIAVQFGATELQGFWFDVLKENDLPKALDPPGVMALRRHHMPAVA